MMAFPGMLVEAAKKANMKTPPDPDTIEYDAEEYPHFHCYCLLQLARPIRWGEHWDNAEIIAKIPADKIMTMTLEDFLALGLHWQQ